MLKTNKSILNFAVIIVLSVIAGSAYSDGYWDKVEGPLKKTINIAEYKITRDEIIEAIFDPIIRNNWEVDNVTKNTITANYKRGAKLLITITSNSIVIEEVPTQYGFKNSWFESLYKHIQKNIKNKHYMRLMKSFD